MDADLTPYFARTWDRPFVWGQCDCTLWVADWCIERWGVDPAASFRGRYDTHAGAESLTAAGLIVTIRPFMTFAREVAAPTPGDVGVVTIGGCETAAICTAVGWAIKTPAGMGEAPMPHLIAWGD